jgi:hypothetical protein
MPADVARWLLGGCSDAPVRVGSIRYPQRTSDPGDRTEWQLLTQASIVCQQLKKNKRTNQRTLNPRVSGFAPDGPLAPD